MRGWGVLLGELRRRNVIRAAGLYLVGAWLVVQVAGTILPMFEAPAWIARTIVVALAIGFLPAMAAAWVFELTPEGLKRDAEVPPEASIAPHTARRLDRAIILVLAVALVFFAVDKFVLSPQREAARTAAPPAAAQAKASERSIAVLPFANHSSDPEQTYFSDGLAEDLITALAQFDGLKVIARNSSFRFRDSKDDPRHIGATLGVMHLLTGTVRRAGDQVRVSAELVDVADGRTLWSQRFDRPYADLFALQDEITAQVALALRAKLLGSGASRDERPPSGDLVAYNLYLQGRYFSNAGKLDELTRAIAYLEDAAARDPAYAHAHAGLARARVLRAAIHLGGAEQRAEVAAARTHMDRALALAPDSPMVRVSNASVLMNGELRWADAEAEAQRAVALAPDLPEALVSLAQGRAALGDTAEAVALIERALERDPLHVVAWFWLSIYRGGHGDLEAALRASTRARELSPGAPQGTAQEVMLLALMGRTAEAIALADAMPEVQWGDVARAIAHQRGPDPRLADAKMARVVETSADSAAYQIAQAYAWRRDPDAMFEWLERAWANRDPGLRRLLGDPFLAPYREDPRFAAFRRKIGLP
jgi:TolB-like protein